MTKTLPEKQRVWMLQWGRLMEEAEIPLAGRVAKLVWRRFNGAASWKRRK